MAQGAGTAREPITLYADLSEESQQVMQLLKDSGRRFRIVRWPRSAVAAPAIETMYGMVSGFDNIMFYFFSGAQKKRNGAQIERRP